MEERKAIVRQHIERIEGVTRTWFEWQWDSKQSLFSKTLVIEVDFNTDPNDSSFRPNVFDAITDTARGVLKDETTMIVSDLRVVPKAAAGL